MANTGYQVLMYKSWLHGAMGWEEVGYRCSVGLEQTGVLLFRVPALIQNSCHISQFSLPLSVLLSFTCLEYASLKQQGGDSKCQCLQAPGMSFHVEDIGPRGTGGLVPSPPSGWGCSLTPACCFLLWVCETTVATSSIAFLEYLEIPF